VGLTFAFVALAQRSIRMVRGLHEPSPATSLGAVTAEGKVPPSAAKAALGGRTEQEAVGRSWTASGSRAQQLDGS
jgi:hypothetical protein